MNSEEILKKYPWIIKEKQKLIISPDSDGFLCALLYLNYFDAEVVGYYDGKIMLCPPDINPKDCLFLDMDIFCKNIKSVGHHMVCFNKNNLPSNWYNYDNCIQINNLRKFDKVHDFQRKYPFATIHFLLTLLSNVKKIKLGENAIVPLLFSDGVWTVLFGYTENCLDWFNWLHIKEKNSILNSIFCGNTSFNTVMEEINLFLRERDKLNSKCTYNPLTLETNYKNRSRTGDKLMISNSHGEPINIKKKDESTYDIINEEQERVKKFITLLSSLMGWQPYIDKWNFSNFKLRKFSKGILDGKSGHEKFNQVNYKKMVEGKCFSMAITSSLAIEYTIDDQGFFN